MKIDKKVILALADKVDVSPDFHMGRCHRCIIGHALDLKGDDEVTWEMLWSRMMETLKLTRSDYRDFYSLTMPRPRIGQPGNLNGYDYQAEPSDGDRFITQQHAAETLRHLAETGEVSWDMGAARLRRRQ